jgi:Cft2 family RNA processing exonuclease
VTRHVTWDRGVSLVGHDLWLDPLTVRDVAFVSHAHSDHTRRHKLAFMTADTLTLLTDARRPHTTRVLDLGKEVSLGSATISLHDAGHMLGSAQLLFEHCGCRLLYTGDLKLRCAAGRATPVPPCEVLVLESTYGRPHFRFPETDSATEQVALWCRRALDARATPVVLAHALGKAQEIMVALAPYGLRFALEERCVPYARGYEEAGVELPDWVELAAVERDPTDRVVISPPAGKEAIRRLGRYRTALVSGWAQDPDFRRLFGADTAFPVSDHCDFDELLEVVRLSGADHVYTVHGFADDLARHLRKRGVRAHPLHLTEQLQLAI